MQHPELARAQWSTLELQSWDLQSSTELPRQSPCQPHRIPESCWKLGKQPGVLGVLQVAVGKHFLSLSLHPLINLRGSCHAHLEGIRALHGFAAQPGTVHEGACLSVGRSAWGWCAPSCSSMPPYTSRPWHVCAECVCVMLSVMPKHVGFLAPACLSPCLAACVCTHMCYLFPALLLNS